VRRDAGAPLGMIAGIARIRITTGHRNALSGERDFVVSWTFSSDVLGRSCHAELVAFRVQHDDVVENPLVILFPHNSGAACHKLGHLGRINRARLAMPHGPSPATRMSIWSRFFADFPSGTRSHPIAGALPSGSMMEAPSGSS
jgi:hypothetical protein